MITGFDSEADRRDAVRKQIISQCVAEMRDIITSEGPTQTYQERRWLELSVAMELLKGLQLEFMSEVYRQEITTAEKEIDKV